MSQGNVQFVLDGYRRFNAGETRPELWFWHEDAEFRASSEDPDTAVHRGLDAIRGQFASWFDAYPDLRVEPLEARGKGDMVFLWVRFSGHGAESGLPMEMELAHVITMRNGRAERMAEFTDRAKGLAAAGFSEPGWDVGVATAEDGAAPMLNAIDAFNAGGVEAALPYLHPEIEWRAPPEWLEDRLYRGHDGIRRLGAHWTQLFDEYRLRVERVIDTGDHGTAILLHQLGRIRGSTDRVEAPLGYLAEIDEGLVTRVEVHFSWEATLEAAGISD